jgi:hypothetical protein
VLANEDWSYRKSFKNPLKRDRTISNEAQVSELMVELIKNVIAGQHCSHRDKKIDPGSRTARL